MWSSVCASLVKLLYCAQGGSSFMTVTYKATGMPLAIQNQYFLQDERMLPLLSYSEESISHKVYQYAR